MEKQLTENFRLSEFACKCGCGADGVWREFAKAHGIEPILGLSERFGGAMIYIPSMSSILRESRNRAIREGKLSPTLSKKQIERICRN